MSTLAERFAAAVDTMHDLDAPSRIMRRILADPVDDGLRAASLDGKVRGGSPESHPERMAGSPARRAGGRHVDDMVAVSKSSTAVVESVIGLLDLCLHRSPDAEGYGWADALKDAHMLCDLVDEDAARATRQAGVVEGVALAAADAAPLKAPTVLEIKIDAEIAWCDLSGERLDIQPIHKTIERFCRGVVDFAAVARRWPAKTGRAPSSIEAQWTSGLADEDCCRICLLIEPVGAIRVERRRGEHLCRVCGDLRRAAGGIEPPPALLGVWHDCDRKGQSVMWRTARSRWLESVGAKVSA